MSLSSGPKFATSDNLVVLSEPESVIKILCAIFFNNTNHFSPESKGIELKSFSLNINYNTVSSVVVMYC
jgi:hypothetical protein